jgi:hypothetical protein
MKYQDVSPNARKDRIMRHIAEFIAVLACSLFTGAAVYCVWLNIRREWNAAWKQPRPNLRRVIAEPVICKQPWQRWGWFPPLQRGFPGRASCGSLLEPCWALLSHLRSS